MSHSFNNHARKGSRRRQPLGAPLPISEAARPEDDEFPDDHQDVGEEAARRVQRDFSDVPVSTARRTQKPVWDQYHVNNGRFLLGIASIVSLVALLGVLFLWLIGFIPAFPQSVTRYGAAYFIFMFLFAIVGVAVSFSQIVEFYGLSMVLTIVSLLMDGWVLGGIMYNFWQCDSGASDVSCVDYYYVDSVMFWLTLALLVAFFVSLLGHAMVVLHVGPSQSVRTRYRRTATASK